MTAANLDNIIIGNNGEPVDLHELAVLDEVRKLRARRDARRCLNAEDRPALAPPPVKPFADWINQPVNPIRYRIESLAPANARVLLAAQFKAGKTSLIANQARALTDGDPFLNNFTVNAPARHLVVIDDELDEDMLREWLRAQNIRNTTAIAEVIALRGLVASFNILDDHVRDQWVRRLRDHACDYLILDCLRPVLDACGLDESRDTGQFLLAYDELLSQAGIGDSTIVHHMGHSNERSRGDSRLLDWPDVLWKIVRENEDPASSRYFSAYGRGVDVREGRLTYDVDSHRLTYVGGSRGDAESEAAFPAVIQLLAALAKSGEDDGLSKNHIEGDLRFSDHKQKAVRGAIRASVERGLVEVMPGPRNSQLHRIKHPCADCGFPVTTGESRHKSCELETEGLSLK
ncbi:AAA family ATPase [Mycobacterium sp. M23085]|uniref:AAA family ATPase n=1 Tax=Mycobacterium sp. M23085 TaxID=3378087 RepID=UPI00387809CA